VLFHAAPTLSVRVQTFECGPKLVVNPEYLELLRRGVDVWNEWRAKEPSVRPNLRRADLRGASLSEANLSGADLSGADLSGVDLSRVDLSGADLSGADLCGATLTDASLNRANLCGANLSYRTILIAAKLIGANLRGANLTRAVHLLLHNEKIRDVIDTITSKVVLILGRFTPERKTVLDALREELRNRGYVPVLFDFDVPAERDITETVTLLARMARFIIADLTDPSSIPKELEAIVPQLAVPVQPLFGGDRPYAMFKDYWKYDWVLPVHQYEDLPSLLETLAEKVIAPPNRK
jgi:hypothetical protein